MFGVPVLHYSQYLIHIEYFPLVLELYSQREKETVVFAP